MPSTYVKDKKGKWTSKQLKACGKFEHNFCFQSRAEDTEEWTIDVLECSKCHVRTLMAWDNPLKKQLKEFKKAYFEKDKR